MIAAFGVLTAGGVVVPVSTRYKTAEAADIITRSGAKVVLVEKGFLGQDFTTPPGVPALDLKSGFLEDGAPFERAVTGTDIADIIYTSGTTGRPKGRDDEPRTEPADVRRVVRPGRPAPR